MPEGDTIFRTARALSRALVGKPITGFRSNYPLITRFHDDTPLTGQVVERVESRGKWLLMHFSGDLILLTHMLMNGSWHIYRPGERWRFSRERMRIIVATEQIIAVAFNLQIAEFHTPETLLRRQGFSALGPSVLSTEFDEMEAANRLLAHPQLEVGDALLKQSIVSGIGNVFKSEICFACNVHPLRKVSSLTRDEAIQLMATARKFLRANVNDTSGSQIVTYTGFRRTTTRANPQERLWVYKRAGEPCRRCGQLLESAKQGLDARVTFWCPACQKSAA